MLEMSWSICGDFTGRLEESYGKTFNVKHLKKSFLRTDISVKAWQ